MIKEMGAYSKRKWGMRQRPSSKKEKESRENETGEEGVSLRERTRIRSYTWSRGGRARIRRTNNHGAEASKRPGLVGTVSLPTRLLSHGVAPRNSCCVCDKLSHCAMTSALTA